MIFFVCMERSRSGDGHFECLFFEHPQVTSVVCVLTRAEWQESFCLWGCATRAQSESG